MKSNYILALLLFLYSAAEAIVVQKLYLKDGSCLYGYIQKQDIDGNLTFHYDSATICIATQKGIHICNERQYASDELEKQWLTWAERNNAYIGNGKDRKLTLADICGGETDVSHVRILQRGEIIEYLDVMPNSCSVPWSDVYAIKSGKRPKTLLTGIERTCQLKDKREIRGQYAGENDSVMILWTEDGLRQSFRIDDVVKTTFHTVNDAQDIFIQSELIDVVKTSDGSVTRGVITERNYAGKSAEDFFLMVAQQSGTKKIKLIDVVEIAKEENEFYNPVTDVLLREGEMMVNRTMTNEVSVTELGDDITLAHIDSNIVVSRGNEGKADIILEYRIEGGKTLSDYKLIKTNEFKQKKDTEYGFSYRNLAINTLKPKKEPSTSVNHTTRVEWIVYDAGIYALYDTLNKKAIPIVVK